MDPGTATMFAAGIQGLGGLLGGMGQGQAQKEQTKAQKEALAMQARQNWEQMGMGDRQYGQNANMQRAQYLDQRGLTAADLRKRMNMTPLADRASYMLAQRAGAAPQAFQARDFTRGTTPGAGQATGGYAPSLNAQAAANQNYTAGAGGMANPELEAAMARLTNMAGVPAEYQAQDADQMRSQSAIADQQERMAMDGRLSQAGKYDARINRLRQVAAGEPMTARDDVGPALERAREFARRQFGAYGPMGGR